MKSAFKKVLLLSLVTAIMAGASFSQAGEKKTIAFSIPSHFSTFWVACWKGVKDQADAYGWDAVLLDPNGDINLQMTQLFNQATRGIDAVAIAPIDSEAIGPAINEMDKKGVPVFCIDRRGHGKVVSTLETDNVYVGLAMARKVQEDYPGKKIKLLIVQGVLSDTPTLDRTAGFKLIAERDPNIKIIGEPSAGAYSNEAAMSTTKNFLESNPDLDAIFTCTDALVPGILAALREAGKLKKVGEPGHVGVYSVDGAGETLNFIDQGTVDATFSQFPIVFSGDCVKAMKDHLEGKPVREKIFYGGDVVSKSNIDKLRDSLWGFIIK